MAMMGPRLDVGIVWAQCDGMVCGSLGTEQQGQCKSLREDTGHGHGWHVLARLASERCRC